MHVEQWLRGLLEGLVREKRWIGHENPTDENILMHMYKMSWIAQIMIAYEREYGDLADIRPYVILQAAVNHDIGESVHGDVLYTHKTKEDEQKEVQAYIHLVHEVVPEDVRRHFPLPPDVDTTHSFSAREIEFWDVCEKVGYVLYAAQEVRLGKFQFQGILDRWRLWLHDYVHFPGVEFFLKECHI